MCHWCATVCGVQDSGLLDFLHGCSVRVPKGVPEQHEIMFWATKFQHDVQMLEYYVITIPGACVL
jgi:hypothetical protein